MSDLHIRIVGIGDSGKNIVRQIAQTRIPCMRIIRSETNGVECLNCVLEDGNSRLERTRGLPDQSDNGTFSMSGSDMQFIVLNPAEEDDRAICTKLCHVAKASDILTLIFFLASQDLQLEAPSIPAIPKHPEDYGRSLPNGFPVMLIRTDKKADLPNEQSTLESMAIDAIYGLLRILSTDAVICVDMIDMRAVLGDSNVVFVGIGKASGSDRVERSARDAIAMLQEDIDSVKGRIAVIYSITTKYVYSIDDVSKIGACIHNKFSIYNVDNILFDLSQNANIEDEIQVVVYCCYKELALPVRSLPIRQICGSMRRALKRFYLMVQ